jgi:hypothetical protein
MQSWVLVAAMVVLTGLAAGARPAAASGEPMPSPACEAPKEQLMLRAQEETGAAAWSPCERWVWSCIRGGQEANLFAKQCTPPRPVKGRHPNLRAPYKFAPFVEPERWEGANALSDGFLRTILSVPYYLEQIPPIGVRIFGAYFKDEVNLENVSTSRNLVLDGSIFRQGLRLTNFHGDKNFSIDGSNVRGKVWLLRSHITGTLFMEWGVFDSVIAHDARIGASIDAARSIFNGDVRLDRAQVAGKVNLVKSRLSLLSAWDASFGGSVELRLADVRGRIDMTGATVNGDVRLQRVTFGRDQPGVEPACDWDPKLHDDHFLSDARIALKDSPGAFERLLAEVVRPHLTSLEQGDVCARHGDAAASEVLLRDMRIKGTLCLIDVTGDIAPPAPATRTPATPARVPQRAVKTYIDTISLDGSQASSTILRWQQSDSPTVWRAVNFKTGYMLINLQSKPARHFIDNIDIGFIAFVKRDSEQNPRGNDETFDKYLCDVTPAERNSLPSGSREAHHGIVKFFGPPGHLSGSAQPFAKIVERLQESGAASGYLKIKLSEFQYDKVCRASAFRKAWAEQPQWWSVRQKARGAWSSIWEKKEVTTRGQALGDLAKVLADFTCMACVGAYKYTVSYGHEPYYLVPIVGFLVLLFAFLLGLDGPLMRASDGEWPAMPPNSDLGPSEGRFDKLLYSIDMFIPFAQLRFDRNHTELRPRSLLLCYYLRFHRLTGFVLSLLVFLLLYRAAR